MTGGVDGVGVGMKQKPVFLRIERTQQHRVCKRFSGRKNIPREIEKVTAVRKEVGPPVGGFIFRRVQRGHANERAARGRNAENGGVDGRGKKNVPFPIPGSASPVGSIADGKRRATRRFNFLELASGKKSDEPAVRRPKGVRGALWAGEGP